MDARVDRAARELDRAIPDWFRQIDVGRLDLSKIEHCICGQLAECHVGSCTAWAALIAHFDLYYEKIAAAVCTQERLGTDTVFGLMRRIEADYRVLQDSWIAAIADRLHPVTTGLQESDTGVTGVFDQIYIQDTDAQR